MVIKCYMYFAQCVFPGLADYQYLPLCRQRDKDTYESINLLPPVPLKSEWLFDPSDVPLCLLPPLFSRLAQPSPYAYRFISAAAYPLDPALAQTMSIHVLYVHELGMSNFVSISV